MSRNPRTAPHDRVVSRCSPCNVNWPKGRDFERCPRCGGITWWQEDEPTYPLSEAQDIRARHLAFEKAYAKMVVFEVCIPDEPAFQVRATAFARAYDAAEFVYGGRLPRCAAIVPILEAPE